MVNFLKRIQRYIKAFIYAYVILPIKGWYRYLTSGVYIEDNERNQQVIDFLYKVSEDKSYQPSSPVEHYLEKHLYEAYLDAIKDHEDIIRNEYDGNIPTYEEVRGECAQQIVLDLLSYRWIDDSKWDD